MSFTRRSWPRFRRFRIMSWECTWKRGVVMLRSSSSANMHLRSFPEEETPHSGQTPCRASNNLHLNRDNNTYCVSHPKRQSGDSLTHLGYLVSRQGPYDFTTTRLVRSRITYKTYNDCHQNKRLVRKHVIRILVKHHLRLCEVEKIELVPDTRLNLRSW